MSLASLSDSRKPLIWMFELERLSHFGKMERNRKFWGQMSASPLLAEIPPGLELGLARA